MIKYAEALGFQYAYIWSFLTSKFRAKFSIFHGTCTLISRNFSYFFELQGQMLLLSDCICQCLLWWEDVKMPYFFLFLTLFLWGLWKQWHQLTKVFLPHNVLLEAYGRKFSVHVCVWGGCRIQMYLLYTEVFLNFNQYCNGLTKMLWTPSGCSDKNAAGPQARDGSGPCGDR